MSALLADVETIWVSIFAIYNVLCGFVDVSYGCLHLRLRVLVQLLRFGKRSLLVASCSAIHVVQPHFLKTLLTHGAAEELVGGIAARSIGREDPCRGFGGKISLYGVELDRVFICERL